MKNRNLNHKDNWQTPPKFYEELNAKHNFDFDPCPLNHDLDLWNGLECEWGKRNFINPPYSDLKETGYLKSSFVKKAIQQAQAGKLCIMLLPVSTSTFLFHDFIQPYVTKPIEFVRRRIPFIGRNDKGQYINFHLIQKIENPAETIFDETNQFKVIRKYIKNAGQHDSMIVTLDGRNKAFTQMSNTLHPKLF